jgi:hypothetical protein
MCVPGAYRRAGKGRLAAVLWEVLTDSIPVSTSQSIPGAISSAGERFPDTEEVTGSIPVSRTSVYAGKGIFFGRSGFTAADMLPIAPQFAQGGPAIAPQINAAPQTAPRPVSLSGSPSIPTVTRRDTHYLPGFAGVGW